MEQWIGSVHSKMAWRTHFFLFWRLSRFGKELFICMCILHIVFCTVCKYVLSICKLFFCTVWSTLSRISLTKALDVTVKVIWFDFSMLAIFPGQTWLISTNWRSPTLTTTCRTPSTWRSSTWGSPNSWTRKVRAVPLSQLLHHRTSSWNMITRCLLCRYQRRPPRWEVCHHVCRHILPLLLQDEGAEGGGQAYRKGLSLQNPRRTRNVSVFWERAL